MSGQPLAQGSKRSRESAEIPRLEFEVLDRRRFMEVYSAWQAVVIEGCTSAEAHAQWDASELSQLYSSERAKAVVDSRFCIEQADRGRRSMLSAETVLGKRRPTGNWYATWIVQHDEQVVDQVLRTLPMPELQPGARHDDNCEDGMELVHSKCVWFFVARCSSDMPGRAEHTDKIAHDGTWHYQLRGKKRWYLRPTEELLSRIKMNSASCTEAGALDQDSALVVECRPGDVLLINTALWWHRTEIPCTTSETPEGLSISYARDVSLAAHKEGGAGKDAKEASRQADEELELDMGNIDNFRVECDIEEGSVIFEEHDMPEVPLPSSSSPNCELIIWEPTGETVLIASRNITAGEFLTVAGSSSPPPQ